jgi:hypothetical protein
MDNINLLAVLVAGILDMAIGAAWYSPVLFAKPWMKATGKKEMGKDNMGQTYGLTMGAALVFSFVVSLLVHMFQIQTATQAIIFGLLCWFAFYALAVLSDYLFVGRPFKLYAINVSYQLVLVLVTTLIVTLWR